MIRKLGVTLILAATLTVAAACGGDDDGEPSPSPSPAPTIEGTAMPSPTADPQSKSKVIEATGAYLAAEGIDGEKGTLTDPIDCARLPEGAKGDYCVVDAASIYAAGLAIVYVSRPGKQADEAWEMRLRPDGSVWVVTGIQPLPSGP